MKNIRSRILCILLAAAMLVPAIAGIANSVFPTAKASTFFTPANGSFFEAKGTTLEQGLEVYKLSAAQTQPSIAEKVYDILFRAQYCVTDFGGDLWCNSNYNSRISSVTDAVLGYVNWGWGGTGCFSYSMFVSQYTRGGIGRNNIQPLPSIPTGAELKNFLAAYADPGEHIHFYYSGSSYGEHSVIYLAGTEEGFYYLSENGNSLDIRLYYSSYDYFASILRMSGGESIRIYSTNTGKDTPTDPGSIVIPFTPAKVAQIMFNGHNYTFFTGADSYEKAAAYAADMGGYLATVTSAEEQAVVNSLMSKASVPFAWIGLTAKDGVYAWVTGEKLLYRNDYDNNTTGSNGFIFTDKLSSGTLNGKWDTCSTEYTIAGTTYGSDSFGFIVEIGTAFPTPIIKISEVMSGLNQYTVFDAGLNYKEAQEFCESIGGHLVTIGSADELATVLKLTKSTSTEYLLGATMQSNSTWAWSDGTAMRSDIAQTLPAASNGEHLVIVTDAENNPYWSIASDTELTGFICEINLSEFYLGDVDMDGSITTADAREVLRYCVGLSNNINIGILGNVDGDVTVNTTDARLLLRAAVDLEDWKKWEKVIINLNDSLI